MRRQLEGWLGVRLPIAFAGEPVLPRDEPRRFDKESTTELRMQEWEIS
jgi:hypothetical protein